ncbi:MAG: hypothetical protein QOI53_146 [Verrucomicrobiota bacterium]|nr:hypothetical protein [Verrucomicrobiota bacterium]
MVAKTDSDWAALRSVVRPSLCDLRVNPSHCTNVILGQSIYRLSVIY